MKGITMIKNTTKECLFTALMLLMEQKSYDKITVTDITRKAGVSRMSFYRCYCTKEDVLLDAADRLLDEFQTELEMCSSIEPEDFAKRYFQKLQKNKNLIKGIEKAGCDEKLFSIELKYNKLIMEKKIKSRPLSIEDTMLLYYHTGGIHEMIKYWCYLDFDIPIEEILQVMSKATPYLPK